MSSRDRLVAATGVRHPRVLADEVIDAARVLFSRRRREGRRLASETRTPDATFSVARHLFPGGPSQDPAEVLPFIEYAAAQTPMRTILEIGTEASATHFLFGQLLRSAEMTIAVDLLVRNRLRLMSFVRPGLTVRHVQGSSRAPWVRERITKTLAGRQIDLLFIDGDHSFFGATEDYRLYAPLVRPGGLIAFHDIVPDARLRTGAQTGSYAGDVPLIWERLKRTAGEVREFVASWEQDGRGIGVVQWNGHSWPFGPGHR